MENIVFFKPLKTTIGTLEGALKNTSAVDLGTVVVKETVNETGGNLDLITHYPYLRKMQFEEYSLDDFRSGMAVLNLTFYLLLVLVITFLDRCRNFSP